MPEEARRLYEMETQLKTWRNALCTTADMRRELAEKEETSRRRRPRSPSTSDTSSEEDEPPRQTRSKKREYRK